MFTKSDLYLIKLVVEDTIQEYKKAYSRIDLNFDDLGSRIELHNDIFSLENLLITINKELNNEI